MSGKSDHLKPTESELEILQVLWQSGSSSVRFVNSELNKHREAEIGYTTTLKLMQIMADKGLVLRDTSDKIHLYVAAVEEEETRRRLLDEFVHQTFRGSTGALVLQALGNHSASADELEAIKALINQIEEGQP